MNISALLWKLVTLIPLTSSLLPPQAGRRRGGSWVKTPGARRPEVAPVTLQGWLYKQGADGLHLWKKRWFVLSEYCLYYYKGECYLLRSTFYNYYYYYCCYCIIISIIISIIIIINI